MSEVSPTFWLGYILGIITVCCAIFYAVYLVAKKIVATLRKKKEKI